MRSSSQAALARKSIDCSEFCAVAAVFEYHQAAEYGQWALAEGSESLFPGVLDGGEKGNLALMPPQMTTTSTPIFGWHGGMEDKRYAMHSFRVGGAASHNMGRYGHGRSCEYVGWKSATVARRCAGVTASVAAVGVTRSRETASIEADALPLSEQFVRSSTAWTRTGQLTPTPPEAKAEV